MLASFKTKSQNNLKKEIKDKDKIDTVIDVFNSLNQSHFYLPYNEESLPEMQMQILNLFNFIGTNSLYDFKMKLIELFTQCLNNDQIQALIDQNLSIYLCGLELDTINNKDILAIRFYHDIANSSAPNLKLINDPSAIIELIATYDDGKFSINNDNQILNGFNLFKNQIQQNDIQQNDKKKCVIV